MRFGVNTWVWASPLDDDKLAMLVPRIAAAGFDWIELPIENPGDFDYARAAELIQTYGLGISVSAVISAERDLIHPEATIRADAAAYIRYCVDAARTLGAPHLIGPLYSAVGRVWQA